VKANPFCSACGNGCILIILIWALKMFTPGGCVLAEDISPPSFLTAIGDQDSKVLLFWFSAHPDTSVLAYHGDQMFCGMQVMLPWRENCAAVRMSSPEAPFFLLRSMVYIPHHGAEGDSSYDFNSPFFVTVNEDSGGIPKNDFSDSVYYSAGEQDSLFSGGWVEIEHHLLMQDSIFWIVFHWEESSPLSPLVGMDDPPNVGSSLWGRRTFFHFEWHPTIGNLMIKVEIVTNGETASEVDSFQVYRSIHPDSLMYQQNLIATLPGFKHEHGDSEVLEDQTYFYRATCVSSGGESRASNLAEATPKRGAALNVDREEFYVHTGSGQLIFENLTLTNPGGLPLGFEVKVSLNTDGRLGGFDPLGYCWTDNDLDLNCEFDWVNIENRGMRLGDNGDDNVDYGFFPLGFPFPFYDDEFDSLKIASDGWISFSDILPCYEDSFLCYKNKSLPWLWGPYQLLAPFWDDLILVDSSALYYYSNADSVIVSFINLHHWGQANSGPYTFQVILTRTGEIKFQYLHVHDSLYSATVGIQNQDGTVGLQVLKDEHLLCDSLCVLIKPGWIKASSHKGWLQPGEGRTLDLAFDPKCYARGIYKADLLIESRDKNHWLETKIIPLTFCIDTTTSVDWIDDNTTHTMKLLQNHPNPFNPTTTIELSLSKPGRVKIEIFNILGQKVVTLLDERLSAGRKRVDWNGKDEWGNEVSSGIYLYRLQTAEFSEAKKMLLLR
jgi:hypothetical protein